MPAAHRIAYRDGGGDARACFGDLYLPPPRPGGATSDRTRRPVVILLHGGCWRQQVTLDYFGQAARALSELGFAVWNIEYRRLGGGGGWPATFEDVAAAGDGLRGLADEHRLDLGRVVALGHSAGGHLALWLAARARLPRDSPLFRPDPLPLRGVVALAGIPDLAEAARRGICQEALLRLLGGRPDAVPERYLHGSPAAWHPLGVAQIHLCGADDAVVPADYVERCVGAAREGGEARVGVRVLERCGHFEPVVAGSSAWPLVERAVLSLADDGGADAWEW